MRVTPHVCWKKQAPSFNDSHSFSISSLAPCSLEGGFTQNFSVPDWLGLALPRAGVSLWLHCWVLLLFYLLYEWKSVFPNGALCLAPCSITASAQSTVRAESWHHHVAPAPQFLRNNHCRGSQGIASLGRLVVACHHVGI